MARKRNTPRDHPLPSSVLTTEILADDLLPQELGL